MTPRGSGVRHHFADRDALDRGRAVCRWLNHLLGLIRSVLGLKDHHGSALTVVIPLHPWPVTKPGACETPGTIRSCRKRVAASLSLIETLTTTACMTPPCDWNPANRIRATARQVPPLLARFKPGEGGAQLSHHPTVRSNGGSRLTSGAATPAPHSAGAAWRRSSPGSASQPSASSTSRVVASSTPSAMTASPSGMGQLDDPVGERRVSSSRAVPATSPVDLERGRAGSRSSLDSDGVAGSEVVDRDATEA